MDTLKIAILTFIAGGTVLYMANVSMVYAIAISALVMTIITIIAVIRYKTHVPKSPSNKHVTPGKK